MTAARTGGLAEAIALAPRKAIIGAIRGYQLVISPMTGPRCRYYPSCSHYGVEAVRVHGAVVGSAMAGWRLLRCNPWSVGGVDDVPAQGERRFRLHRNNDAMLVNGREPAANLSEGSL
jgi:putative membrane protein insertion efficiency factor